MVKKLRVTTRTTAKLLKKQIIKEDVFKHPEGTTPTLIHLSTGLNINTIKNYLGEIEEVKQKGYAGLWIPNGEKGDSPLRIPEPKIHDEVISCKIPNYKGNRIEEEIDYKIIKYIFTLGKTSKKATFRRIAVDKEQLPVEIPTILVVIENFKSLIKKHTGISPCDEEIIFKPIEFNETFENLKMSFGNCFTLKSLNCMYKIYQKKKGVRVEAKLKDINAETLFEFFKGNYKVVELEEIIKKLAESQANIENYLLYLCHILPSNTDNKKEIIKKSYIKQTTRESTTFKDIFDKSPRNNNKTEVNSKPKEPTDRPVKDEYEIVYF